MEPVSASVAVVVLNWNDAPTTLQCIEALHAQTISDFEVYVVDNGSESSDLEVLEEGLEKSPRVQFIKNGKNLGFGRAHNALLPGFNEKGYPWLAFLNNDTVPNSDWLENLLEGAQQHDADFVCSKMLQMNAPDRIDNTGHIMLNTGEIMPRGYGAPSSSYSEAEEVLGPCGGAGLYRTAAFDQLQGFDEHFFLGYEDAEFSLRSWLCGYKCIYVPGAIVHHHGSKSINEIRDTDYLASIQAHIFYTWFKLMPLAILWRHMPWFVSKYSAVLLIDVVLLRFRFLRVMLKGMRIAWEGKDSIQAAREAFYKGVETPITRTTKEINQLLQFFLILDAKRFWYFVVLRKKSMLEA